MLSNSIYNNIIEKTNKLIFGQVFDDGRLILLVAAKQLFIHAVIQEL